MYHYKLSFSILYVIFIGSLFFGIVHADIITSPESIAIFNENGGETSRNVLLFATSNTTNIQFISSDILRDDGGTVFKANNIIPQIDTNILNSGEVTSVPILFNFQNTSAGLYTGSILISYKDGQTQLPVTIQIKDTWVWPFILLLVTVIVSVLSFSYKAKGRKKDLLLRKIMLQKARMEADNELKNGVGKEFYDKIIQEIANCYIFIKADEIAAATLSYEKAEAIRSQWSTNKKGWSKLLNRCQDLKKKIIDDIENLKEKGQFPYLIGLNDNLNELLDDPIQFNNPKEMKDLVDKYYNQYYTFSIVVDTLEEIERYCKDLDTETDRDKCFKMAQNFWHELNMITYDQESAIKDLERKSSSYRNEIYQPIAVKKNLPMLMRLSFEQFLSMKMHKLVEEEIVTPEEEESRPGPGIWLFPLYTYFIASVTLFGLGFLQLYINNTTFGATIADYITLAFWGLGIGVASEGIHQKVRDMFTAE